MTALNSPASHNVSTNLDDELSHLIEGSKIMKYWTNHFTIPNDVVNQINWLAIEKACSNQTSYNANGQPSGLQRSFQEAQKWKTEKYGIMQYACVGVAKSWRIQSM
eukprot:3281547-Ditylum_brightwellii.AAC.1